MCNRRSNVMFPLYCVNTKIKMQAARVKYTKDERIFLLISYLCNHVYYTMILVEFAKTFPKLTNPLHAAGMLQYCSVSLKKQIQLRMCCNLGSLVWHQCGRIWKIGPRLRWKILKSLCQLLKRMKYRIYQPRLVSTYTFLLSILPGFFVVLLHVQIEELTLAALCIKTCAGACG